MYTINISDETGTKIQYLKMCVKKPRKQFAAPERCARAMRAWLRWCCCCECLGLGKAQGRGPSGDGKDKGGGLLQGKGFGKEAPRSETCYYSYNVRRISSFGRAESKEGLQWSGEDSGDAAERSSTTAQATNAPSWNVLRPTPSPSPSPRPSPRPSPCRSLSTSPAPRSSDSETIDVRKCDSCGSSFFFSRLSSSEYASLRGSSPQDDVGGGGGGGGRRGPWFKRIKKLGRGSRLRLNCDLAASSPDLARLSGAAAGTAAASSHSLRPLPARARGAGAAGGGALGAVGALGASAGCVALGGAGDGPRLWARARSMESVDLSPEPSTFLADDIFQGEETSKTIAESVGLNISLYSLTPSVNTDPPIYKSTSRLLLWSPSKSELKSEFKKENKIENTANTSNNAPTLATLPIPVQPIDPEDFVDPHCGSIVFTASYNQKSKKLSIQLNKLENLPPKGKNRVCDIIVRLCILPSEKQLKTSQVLQGSLSPTVQEDFSFSMKEPVGKVLRFSVFDVLLQGKHDAIGHALFNVEDIISGRNRRYSMKLSRQSQLEPSFGSLQIFLQLTQDRLILDVIQARNLSVSHIFKSSRSSGKFSTFVKITFYCASHKVKSKKSPIVTSDRNPRYEYSCEFKTISDYMDDCYIVISVILKVNLGKDVTLGRYILGPHFFAENHEMTPWGHAVLNREEVHHWFHLYL